jgi:FKBP-type peptidyl-prolyl cis-trans isomerase
VRRLVVPAVVIVGLVLGACGSTKSSSTSTTAGSPTASGSPANSSTQAPAATSAPPAAANPPMVSSATDVKKEPVIGPGASPAPTKLETKDLVVGTGATAVASSTVDVYYVGANYANGKVFDDTPWKMGQPSPFPLSGVVPGFAQGIEGMKVGGRREIVIPSALGYGPSGDPPAVAPNETLVFVVDLVAVH